MPPWWVEKPDIMWYFAALFVLCVLCGKKAITGFFPKIQKGFTP